MRLVTEDGREFELKPGVNSIGRGEDNDIPLPYPGVSRHHAKLILTRDQCLLKDLGSSNGTYVDGAPVGEKKIRAVKTGARIALGSRLKMTLIPSPASAAGGKGTGARRGRAGATPAPRPTDPTAKTILEKRPRRVARTEARTTASAAPAGPGLGIILAALDLAFDRRKIVVVAAGLFAGSAVASIGALVASAFAARSPAAALAAMVVAAAGLWCAVAFSFGVVSRLTCAELLGPRPEHTHEAVAYAKRHLAAFVLAAPVEAGIAILVIALETLALHGGRIPGAGDIYAALLFPPIALLNALLLAALLLGTPLVFAIVADKGTGTLRTLRLLAGLAWRAPARLLCQLSAAAALSWLAAGALIAVSAGALALTAAVMGYALGEEKADLLWRGLMELLAGPSADASSLPVSAKVAAVLFSACGVAAALLVAALPPLFLTVAACAVYSTVRSDLGRARIAHSPRRGRRAGAGGQPVPGRE